MLASRRGDGGIPGSSGRAPLSLGALLLIGALPIAAAADPAGEPTWMAPDTSSVTEDPALEGLPIRSIDITSRNIFDPVPKGALRPLCLAANKLHIRTRAQTVRDQLILTPDSRWTSDRAHEAARQLRTLGFLEPDYILARPAGDSVDVQVHTHDFWTTQPEFDIQQAAGRNYGALAFSERNLLGLGKSLTLAYREDPVGITRGIELHDPGFAGSRLQLHYSASRGTSGSTDFVSAGVPFYAEDTRNSFGLQADKMATQSHLFQNNSEVAIVPEHVEESETQIGIGRRDDGNILRWTGSFYSLDRRLGATQLVGTSAPPDAFVGSEESLRLRRLALQMRFWRPHYVERTGIERIDRVEDYDLGTSLSLKMGYAPEEFGSTADEGYGLAQLDLGAQTALGFGFLRSSLSSRLRHGPRETLGTIEARWIRQTSLSHALVAAVVGTAGYDMPRTFQVTVGGLNGLRAYPVHAVAGTQVLRWNVEDRLVLIRDVLQMASLGSAIFYDGARGWGPGSEGSGAFNSAGIGLRIAPPRSALGPVFRVDLAWPISPTRDGRRQPVISIGSNQAF
jgi:hypothetical protein